MSDYFIAYNLGEISSDELTAILSTFINAED
jgi:hypothetical protein